MNYKYVALPNPAIGMGHVYTARCIVDNALGGGYFSEHLNQIECAWACTLNGKVVGWAAAALEGDFGVLKCVVVDPDHRGNGIGQELTKIRLKYLENNGCKILKSYAWVRTNGQCPSCRTLERNGFTAKEELQGFYSNCKHRCPLCKDNCKCVARVYQKRL